MRLLCGALVQAGEMQIQQVARFIMHFLLAEVDIVYRIAILHHAHHAWKTHIVVPLQSNGGKLWFACCQ